ncbi:ABC transporter substrate-binding protein [Roseomonas chloroacetimidivorans]|uniref:ABC transporter substrate-binding protein n=1 Tax=Roseomonas chloroacetimidivorans TaxID=1766656 RepID=UPI003C740E9A
MFWTMERGEVPGRGWTRRGLAGLLSAAAASPRPASAQSAVLRIGMKSQPTSLDPQFDAITSNSSVICQICEPLVDWDNSYNLRPLLATRWTIRDPLNWEIELRPDVLFSDGKPFTAEDVIFTLDRLKKVRNGASTFRMYGALIGNARADGPHRLLVTTLQPHPLLMSDLAQLPILSRAAASGEAPEGRTTAEMNTGTGLIGTGPYRFISWNRGAEITLERNERYRGPAPAFGRAILRPITDSGARVAALLSGDVDLIEDPPTDNVEAMGRDTRLTMVETLSNRLMFLSLDVSGEPSPGIGRTDGRNPLKDVRVRQALSLALDREALVARVMSGVAKPAGDFLPRPIAGTLPDRERPPRADPARARALLAEAGWGEGFDLTLVSPIGRYVNDVRLAQAIAGFWTRIGIRTAVESAPPATFFTNARNRRYSAWLVGWTNGSGETSQTLRPILGTRGVGEGWGGANNNGYSSPEMDRALQLAMLAFGPAERRALLERAGRIALDDHSILPVLFEVSTWAMRRGLAFEGRVDQRTMASLCRPAT